METPESPLPRVFRAHSSAHVAQEAKGRGWGEGGGLRRELDPLCLLSPGPAIILAPEARRVTQTPSLPVGAELGWGWEQEMSHHRAEKMIQDMASPS